MSVLVDAHVHYYSDKAAGQRARAEYEIWEYGDGRDVMFASASGDLNDLIATYGEGHFDRIVLLNVFDSVRAREAVTAKWQSGEFGDRLPTGGMLDEIVTEAMMSANLESLSVTSVLPVAAVLVSVDPLLLSPRQMASHLAELVNRGARGVKLHPIVQGFSVSDPRLSSFYDICGEIGLTLLCHSGPGRPGETSATPKEFIGLLEKWPHLKVVLAHLGGASWYESAEISDSFPQLVFDLSEIIEWVGAPRAPTSRELVELIGHIGPDRVMFGSDFPWYDPVRTAEKVTSLPRLGVEASDRILGLTALRVYNL